MCPESVWWTDRLWWGCVLKAGDCLLCVWSHWLRQRWQYFHQHGASASQGNEAHTNALTVPFFTVLTNFNPFWKMNRNLCSRKCVPASFLKSSDYTKVNAKIIVAIWVINSGCVGVEITRSEPKQTEREVACCNRDTNWRSWVSSKSTQQENLLEVLFGGWIFPGMKETNKN